MALGLGSNLIVRDGGVPGVVVRLGKAFARVEQVDATTLRCGGGASGILVSSTARDAGIGGLEFLRSHPRHGRRLRADERRRLWPRGQGHPGRVRARPARRPARDAGRRPSSATPIATASCPKARSSSAPRSAAMPSEPAAIQAEMDRIAAEREASQPLRSRTGGSTFKNPPGTKAWKLIDAAGCRGPARSATRRSPRSIATSCSTSARRRAADIEALGEEVRRRVRERQRRRARMGNPAGGSDGMTR